jgi:hypothetical protein
MHHLDCHHRFSVPQQHQVGADSPFERQFAADMFEGRQFLEELGAAGSAWQRGTVHLSGSHRRGECVA